MPYEWKDQESNSSGKHLVLWPHRSLPRRGFAAFIMATFLMITLPLYPLLGTLLLWGVLPFLMMALAGLWWGLERSYRSAQLREDLVIDHENAFLTRINPNGEVQKWECNRYWVKTELHANSGPVPNYITLKGSDRQVEIGAFLSEEERVKLYPEIRDALNAGSRSLA